MYLFNCAGYVRLRRHAWLHTHALGQALRKLRTERGWSQSDLALRADMDRNYLSLIELGRNSPSVRMLLRLCLALDVRAADVLDDVERCMALLKARD